MTRKIIYSPEYGAGWTSWEGDYEVQKFMIDYFPIIKYLESGKDFKEINFHKLQWSGPYGGPSDEEINQFPDCIKQFVIDCRHKFRKVPSLSGLRDAEIKEVNGPVKIVDHDGYESVEEGHGEWL